MLDFLLNAGCRDDDAMPGNSGIHSADVLDLPGIETPEAVRGDASIKARSPLRPAFTGVRIVTAGNSSAFGYGSCRRTHWRAGAVPKSLLRGDR